MAERHPADMLSSRLKLILQRQEGVSNLRVIIIGGIESGNIILQNEGNSGPK